MSGPAFSGAREYRLDMLYKRHVTKFRSECNENIDTCSSHFLSISELSICTTDDFRMVGMPLSFLCACKKICDLLVLPILQPAKDLTTGAVRTQHWMFNCPRSHPSCVPKAPYFRTVK